MNSPRSGFRRAAIASWALAGLGVAGVAGASEMAYADTLKPPAAEPIQPAPEALLPTEQAIPGALPLPTAAPTETPQVPAPAPEPAPAPRQAPEIGLETTKKSAAFQGTKSPHTGPRAQLALAAACVKRI